MKADRVTPFGLILPLGMSPISSVLEITLLIVKDGFCPVKVYLQVFLLLSCVMGALGACVCDRSVCVEAACMCAELGTAPGSCQCIVFSYDCRYSELFLRQISDNSVY